MSQAPSLPGPRALYDRDCEQGTITADPYQLEAVDALELRFRQLLELGRTIPCWQRLLRRLVPPLRPVPPPGLYLWGGVGRGKTYLMDLFFHALPGKRKLRMHFHRFMLHVHQRLQQAAGQADPLQQVAAHIAAEVDVICFDEFFVADIGDAMILANLLEALFAAGVMLVATSNIPPDRLYERGLQRQKFLPAIGLLKTNTEVLHLSGELDYRLRSLDRVPVFLTPHDATSQKQLEQLFAELTRGLHVEADKVLEVEGRRIPSVCWAEGVVWFDFGALCRGARGAADYIELARQFHTVFVVDVPVMGEARDDEARRFLTLVDEFYDRGVKLVVSAAAVPTALYTGRELRFPYQRTASRLLEMQTRDYLAGQHRPD